MDSSNTLKHYKKIQKIGEGAYGVVYKCTNTETQETVALKHLRIENDEQGLPATSLREISLLQDLKHPYVVSLKEILYEQANLNLVFEYVDQDLRNYMMDK